MLEIKKSLADRENGEAIIEVLQGADYNNSGKIEYVKFMSSLIDANVQFNEELLLKLFLAFDKNKKGKICKKELS